MSKLIVSLFDYTGNWSRPYREAGYDVIQIDLKHGDDVMDFKPRRCHGILAAPPCTEFSVAGVGTWKWKDAQGITDTAIQLIERTIYIIANSDPEWWALENPPGRLNTLVPVLKHFGPRFFQPYWYGDYHPKKTGLWGCYRMPKQTHWPRKDEINWRWADTPYQADIAEFRSRTPMGFARAFYRANR